MVEYRQQHPDKENFVSLETALLLKKIGFPQQHPFPDPDDAPDASCDRYYLSLGEENYEFDKESETMGIDKEDIAAPYLSQAALFLQKEYGLYVMPQVVPSETKTHFTGLIRRLNSCCLSWDALYDKQIIEGDEGKNMARIWDKAIYEAARIVKKGNCKKTRR